MVLEQNYLMKTRSHSVSVLTLQKTLPDSATKDQFIPFKNERKLGKLIKESEQKQDRKLKEINFKNFKAVYRREAIIEQARYSQLTRKSNQMDLLSDKGWLPKTTKPFTSSRATMSNTERFRRNCCSQSKLGVTRIPNKFDKMDENIYKKIALEQPTIRNNPEIELLFQHYVEVCEMNENIRREELTKKKKY